MQYALPLLLLIPSLAEARLCTYEKDGQTFISDRRVPGAKLLGCLDGGPPPRKRARTSKRKATQRVAQPGQVKKSTVRARRYESIVREAAQVNGLPEALIWAVMRVESDFQPHVVSHKGAMGLMQLMPGTASDMGVEDPFDPWQNIMGGSRYLRLLANRFGGDTVKMIAGYHAGGGAVSRSNGIPYRETGEYLRRVLNAYYAYQERPPTRVE